MSIVNFFSYIEASNPEKIKEALWSGEKNAIAVCEFIRVKKERGYRVEIDEIEEADDTIIAYNDARLCVKWAKINIEGINISKLEDIVIQYKYADYIYEFARYVKGANIVKLEDAYIACVSSSFRLKDFAKYVEGANIEKLEDAIIKICDSHDIYYFAKEVEGVNLYKLRKALKAKKDSYKGTYMSEWTETFGAKGLFKNNW